VLKEEYFGISQESATIMASASLGSSTYACSDLEGLAQICKLAGPVGTTHHSSSEPSQTEKTEETGIVLHIITTVLVTYIYMASAPLASITCALLSPHRTSRDDGSCLAAARVHHTSSHGPASLQGSILC